MPWDPATYNAFKEIRYKPFYDLVDMVDKGDIRTAVDLGCGTGEQTSILSKQLGDASVLGIDSSDEMLKESTIFVTQNLRFRKATITELIAESSKWDLIFSNAALQWEDDHHDLFPNIISHLSPGGQLAVQVPFQKKNVLNQMLLEIVNEKPFAEYLNGYTRESPLLTIDEYSKLLFESGLEDINIMLKVYPIIAQDESELFKFISGSALIPYLERLNVDQQNLLSSTFLHRIRTYFGTFPAIYSFKRLLIYGRRSGSHE
jgi:trans-aconitate 2-methyltransferase